MGNGSLAGGGGIFRARDQLEREEGGLIETFNSFSYARGGARSKAVGWYRPCCFSSPTKRIHEEDDRFHLLNMEKGQLDSLHTEREQKRGRSEVLNKTRY